MHFVRYYSAKLVSGLILNFIIIIVIIIKGIYIAQVRKGHKF